tara:strand:+ start:1583 stop:2365 length:783 start_codon:yes stop_codon:yes gene_type:complete
MKKHYFFNFLLLLIPVSAFILMSNSSGRTSGSSGSPGDGGKTCTECHAGGNFSASLQITDDIPAGGYELNTDYNITVTNTSTASKHGFQVTAEKTSNDSKVGIFTAGTGSQAFSNDNYLTHTTSGNNQNSWSFTWTSPATDEGEIKFYSASIAANGNGGTTGDQVVTTSTGGVTTLGIPAAKRLSFEMYPNPALEDVTIQLPSDSEKATVEFYDNLGKLALKKTISSSNDKMNVKELTSGTYILKVISEDKIGSQKFIKK